jgi:alpha-tubulin suppressor-like RCC1 family protein
MLNAIIFLHLQYPVSYYLILYEENGKIYGWGDNSCGTLGLKFLDNILIPTEITGLEKLKLITNNLSCHCFAMPKI